jgi:transposase
MKQYISFDSHKKYTLAERMNLDGSQARQQRIEHTPGAITRYLSNTDPGQVVAVEAIGHWYWIIEEIEAAGCTPALVHPRKAKLMMGMINKTDALDVHGLNRLQQNGVLPTVWIAPKALRDLRELTRLRIRTARDRTSIKNRITATLEKFGRRVSGCSDSFGKRARQQYPDLLRRLPEQARWKVESLLERLDLLNGQMVVHEKRLDALLRQTPAMARLQSLPGIGTILSATIALEVGDVTRFPTAEHLASYAGTTPRVHSSGGKTRFGRCRPDVNRYLKWAFAEAGNSVAVNHVRRPDRHVSHLYRTLRQRRNHSIAVGAVARHLAEAAWHVLSKGEAYLDPNLAEMQGRSTPA